MNCQVSLSHLCPFFLITLISLFNKIYESDKIVSMNSKLNFFKKNNVKLIRNC